MAKKDAAARLNQWKDVDHYEEMLILVDEIEAKALFPTGERYRYEKRGTTYDIYGIGHANSAREFDLMVPGFHRADETRLPGKKVLFDRAEVVIYRDVQSGDLSIRAKEEFLDGRFTLLPQLPGARLPDPARALIPPVASAAPSPVTNGQPAQSESPYGGTQRVKYSGPTVKLRGQQGSVISWVGGNLFVDWDDKEAMEGLSQINAFNVTEVSSDV